MSSSKVLLAFIAGAAVGAVAGVLLAPDEGKNTRKKIAGKASELSGTIKDKMNDFIDGLKEIYSTSKNEAEEMTDKAVAKMNALKAEAKKPI